uniref:RGS domain-containing protein n=2 Tax=Caenorhabditis tropicalis TaxID=1561998 RepID=A0A1I7V4Q2_9PELO
MASLTQCLRKVDWVPLITRDVVDDFASHLRLFRKSRERTAYQIKEQGKKCSAEDWDIELLSNFFDFELEMEKSLCRDLLSTTPHYENVRKVIIPTLDYLSNPNEIFQLIVWLLSEVEPKPDDFTACITNSVSIDELEAVYRSIMNEKVVMRGKDSGGEQDTFVKQQLASLQYVENLVRRQIGFLGSKDSEFLGKFGEESEQLVQLPLHVILTNSTALCQFCEFLKSAGGQNYIDFYLAIEGFKISVEHQMRSLSKGELSESDAYETVKEAAKYMYDQYLSDEAITRVPLDEAIISKFLQRLKNDEPHDLWFESIQEKVYEILKMDVHFFPAFRKSPAYVKMLLELEIIDEDHNDPTLSECESLNSFSSQERSEDGTRYEAAFKKVAVEIDQSIPLEGETVMTATVETLGIGHQGKQTYALYNVRVSRRLNGSEPSLLRNYSDMDRHVFDFLSQKRYANSDHITKKLMSAMFDPIKNGVRAVGSTVMAVPDQVFEGVTKMGAGINNAAKIITNPISSSSVPTKPPVMETDRVTASLTDMEAENIPLRVLVLVVNEIFGEHGSAWFRRQLVTVIRHIVTPFGTSINKRIVDIVNWLTSEQQVLGYLNSFRKSMWPTGGQSKEYAEKPAEFHHLTRILAKTLMLSSLPDELRIILGSDVSYKGINTISEAFQNKQLNRRLLYVLLERLLIKVFPSNRFEKTFAQLHSKSPRTKKL